jgi:hypothetical protein
MLAVGGFHADLRTGVIVDDVAAKSRFQGPFRSLSCHHGMTV